MLVTLPYEMPELVTSAPLDIHRSTVLPEWLDWNGHMNVAFYVLAFDQASGAFMRNMGLGRYMAVDAGRQLRRRRGVGVPDYAPVGNASELHRGTLRRVGVPRARDASAADDLRDAVRLQGEGLHRRQRAAGSIEWLNGIDCVPSRSVIQLFPRWQCVPHRRHNLLRERAQLAARSFSKLVLRPDQLQRHHERFAGESVSVA